MELAQYAYLLPVGFLISAIYSSTGISGANFWAVIYIVWLGVDPLTGFWLSLFSMLFGSLGGLFAHFRHRNIRTRLALRYLSFAAPAAVAGTLAAQVLPILWLVVGYGFFVSFYGGRLLARMRDGDLLEASRPATASARSVVSAGGGFLTGLISVGVGEVLLPHCLGEEEIDRPGDAAGTTLVVVFVTSLVATLARLRPSFLAVLGEQRQLLLSILIWVIPAVIAGSQLGPVISSRLSRRSMTTAAAALLLVVGALMLFYGVFLAGAQS